MKRIVLALLAALLLFGCAARGGQTESPAESLTAGIEPSAGAEPAIVPDYRPLCGFSFALLSEALGRTEDKNAVLSPLSAYLCLAMLQNGAAGETLAEFEKLLGFDTGRLNAESLALVRALSETSGSTALAIANSAWADDDAVTVNDSFLRAIVDYYGADMFSVDLPSDAAKDAVNAWVKERTNGLIPSLRDDVYPGDTRLVLINTLYFKGIWRVPFWADNTYGGTFTLAGGETPEVPFMHMNEVWFDYIQGEDADGVILPYDDHKMAFVALRPMGGADAAALAASLDAARFAALLDSAETRLMDLSVPKYEAEFSMALNDTLKGMGLNAVFDPAAADLSGAGAGVDGPLYLSLVQQKVRLIVDERGTEAAAVTEAAAAGAALIEEKPLDFRLDSPFVYAVVDLESGLPLFIGVLDDPR